MEPGSEPVEYWGSFRRGDKNAGPGKCRTNNIKNKGTKCSSHTENAGLKKRDRKLYGWKRKDKNAVVGIAGPLNAGREM